MSVRRFGTLSQQISIVLCSNLASQVPREIFSHSHRHSSDKQRTNLSNLRTSQLRSSTPVGAKLLRKLTSLFFLERPLTTSTTRLLKQKTFPATFTSQCSWRYWNMLVTAAVQCYLKPKRKRILAVVLTAIEPQLFDGGHTAHYVIKMPISINLESTRNIEAASQFASELCDAHYIFFFASKQ